MLKVALCLNVVILCLLALILCINSFRKKSRINWLKVVALHMLIAFVNLILIDNCLDLGWNLLFVYFFFFVTEILFVITIIKCLISRKNKTEKPSIHIVIQIIAVPTLLFLITYSYELYKVNTCDYLIQYNYQNGIVISDDTYFAVTNHKPAKVTLINNLFDRKITHEYSGISTNIYCSIRFDENGEQTLNIYGELSKSYESLFKELGTKIYSENSDIDYIEIHYIPEANDAIVRTSSNDYIYHANEKTAEFSGFGILENITVY